MSDVINLRNLIIDILISVDRDGEFSHMAVRRILDANCALSRQERAFIKRVAEGTIERQIELDYIAEQFSSVKVKKMKPVIRAIVRSGIYQLKYMDSVPDSAVVNEAVKLARKRGLSGLTGFVNGLLRAVAAGLNEVQWPDAETEPVRYLSVKYSMPEWIARRFTADYGRDRCERILEAYQEDAGTWVRVDTRRAAADEVRESLQKQGITVIGSTDKSIESVPFDNIKISSEKHLLSNLSSNKEYVGKDERETEKPCLAYALLLENIDRLEDLPEFKAGLIYPQNIASMMVAEIAAPGPGDLVLDVCAAPGGKAIHIAQKLMQEETITITNLCDKPDTLMDTDKCCGHVIACDISEAKADLIRENAARCRTPNVEVRVHDATAYDPAFADAFDIVLADLPCSGLGVMGDKTDLRYRTSPERISALAQLQRKILTVVRQYVKPGGKLIYSTCTMTHEENQDNAVWFRSVFTDFIFEEERIFFPDEGCDGFYICKFIRKTGV